MANRSYSNFNKAPWRAGAFWVKYLWCNLDYKNPNKINRHNDIWDDRKMWDPCAIGHK
jgi:hypothetical protein